MLGPALVLQLRELKSRSRRKADARRKSRLFYGEADESSFNDWATGVAGGAGGEPGKLQVGRLFVVF